MFLEDNNIKIIFIYRWRILYSENRFLFKYKTLTKENITKFYIQKKWPIDIDYRNDLKVAKLFIIAN